MEQTLYLKPIHQYAYKREGELPKIIGIVSYTPKGYEARPCYKVQYLDGKIDYVPIQSVETGHHQMTTKSI